MYNQQSIDILINRIGWGKTINDATFIEVDQENLTATSGRFVNSFHQLASVENIYSAVAEVNMEEMKFNEFLSSLRKQSVLEVITAIVDQSELYDFDLDYSDLITSKALIFDDAIGYCIAIKALELFVSTSRKNLTERSASLNFQTLKFELEGAKNDRGHFIAKGIVYKKEVAIKKAQRILFPNPVIIDGSPIW